MMVQILQGYQTLLTQISRSVVVNFEGFNQIEEIDGLYIMYNKPS
jgi:hypothetical protein